ncbi:MAG: HPP family protein [Rhodocyclaceae bacterium]|nr:HPP family protein [Rhodocyclaceae bacterium]MBK6676201.1 HPP family protein [Rhodocyclaceae bacterium]MBK9312228.1 HPP family protein [Rhodocyclaceae bacterium]
MKRLQESAWFKALGIELSPVSHRERLVSALGGLLGILLVYVVSRFALDGTSSPIMSFSMGSTAVMLFAVPHGPLSQPWPLLGGHLLSGLIGITCLLHVPEPMLAGSLAVGLSIGAMHYLRCLHPPAGATALVAAMGGDTVRALGYGFVAAPVMLNVLIILSVAIVFNFLFPWRRYPLFLMRAMAPARPESGYAAISHEDFVYALTQMDSFIDVSEEDLLRIYALATGRHQDLAAAERRAAPPFV